MKPRKIIDVSHIKANRVEPAKSVMERLADNPFFKKDHLPENLRAEQIWAVSPELIRFETDRIDTEQRNWAEFCKDIEEKNGNTVPVILNQPDPDARQYEVLDGRRRVRAIKEICERRKGDNLPPLFVNAVIRQGLGEEEKELLQYQSNTYREDYSVVEFIENTARLKAKGRNLNQISKLLLRDIRNIRFYLRISERPDLKTGLAEGRISFRDAIRSMQAEGIPREDLPEEPAGSSNENAGTKGRAKVRSSRASFPAARFVEKEGFMLFKVDWTRANREELLGMVEPAGRLLAQLKERTK